MRFLSLTKQTSVVSNPSIVKYFSIFCKGIDISIGHEKQMYKLRIIEQNDLNWSQLKMFQT